MKYSNSSVNFRLNSASQLAKVKIINTTLALIALAIACFPLLPEADAGVNNTATGDYTLADITTGSWNTADGYAALQHDTTGSVNTGIGNAALALNLTGSRNTAVGSYALTNYHNGNFNTATGYSALTGPLPPISDNVRFNTADGAFALTNNLGDYNTATGFQALSGNTSGNFNTATGSHALAGNTTGSNNTANGTNALNHNQTGIYNTGIGVAALALNTTGSDNTATGFDALGNNSKGLRNTSDGFQALASNTTIGEVSGNDNTATGYQALFSNTIGLMNTAIGYAALRNNVNGQANIALGAGAGYNITGNLNIDIGHAGITGESNTIRIGTIGAHTTTFVAGISGVNEGGTIAAVYINSNGRLGTQPPASSRRFKKDIEPMDKTSEAILTFRPVTFHYISDKANTPQFGLIAEEVARINPGLVVRDDKGEIYSVRYDQVNAMLLNEFLKEHQRVEAQHKTIEKQEATIAELKSSVAEQQKRFGQQEARIEVLTLGLQKVSVQLEMSKPAARIVAAQP